jgi:hypothetical protein
VLFVVLLIVWSVDPTGYYFGVLVKPWFITAAILGRSRSGSFWFGPFGERTCWTASWG